MIKALIWICLAGVVLVGGINLYIIAYADRFILPLDKVGDLQTENILVLGAGVKPDGTPSDLLEDRLLTAVAAREAGCSDTLLLSGDHRTDDYNEVGAMERYVMAQGVAQEEILLDHAGLSTYESMSRAKQEFNTQSTLVVTQRYHLYRAIYLGRKMGMETYGVSANRRTYVAQSWYDLREAAARVKDFFKVFPTAK